MQRTRMSVLLISFVILLLMLAPGALAQPGQPNTIAPQLTPTAPAPVEVSGRAYLPVMFSHTTTVTPKIAFWANQYTLPDAGCATLSWDVVGASGVWLDGAPVTLNGTQQACPMGDAQFYTLEAQFGGPVGVRSAAPQGAIFEIREVVLTTGDPFLTADEVIAQAKIGQITPAADVDPQLAGDQPGYQLALNALQPLYVGTPGWSHAQVTLGVPQSAIDFGVNGPLHWPLRVGQNVEFRASCDAATCLLDYTMWHYLYMTSE